MSESKKDEESLGSKARDFVSKHPGKTVGGAVGLLGGAAGVAGGLAVGTVVDELRRREQGRQDDQEIS